MLSEFFESAARIRALRDGPAGALFTGFAQALSQAGYAEITARRHLRAAEHFISWADRNGTPVRILSEQSLQRFGRHLHRCRCPRYGHADRLNVLHGARVFLRHLHETGVIGLAAVESPVHDPALLMAFCQWMRQQRGTCVGTLSNYGIHIRALLKHLGEEPDKFDARSLRQFVLEVSQASGWAAAKKCTTALRMFLRFLIAEADAPLDWMRRFRSWRTGALPLSHGTCTRTRWKASSRRAISRRRSVGAIVPSCCSWHVWGSGQATSFSFACTTSIGEAPRFTSVGKAAITRDCR